MKTKLKVCDLVAILNINGIVYLGMVTKINFSKSRCNVLWLNTNWGMDTNIMMRTVEQYRKDFLAWRKHSNLCF